jgi:hypothetical protein
MARHRHSNRAQLLAADGRRLKAVHESQAWDLVWSGWAVLVTEAPLTMRLLERRADPASISGSDPGRPAITANEMLINALAKGQRAAGAPVDSQDLRRVAETERKIEAYPYEGDRKAPRVGITVASGER